MANVFDAEQRDTARRIGGAMRKGGHLDDTNARIPSEAPLKVFKPDSAKGLPEQKSFRDNTRPQHGTSRTDFGSGTPVKSIRKK
jgi:hypothetical protein